MHLKNNYQKKTVKCPHCDWKYTGYFAENKLSDHKWGEHKKETELTVGIMGGIIVGLVSKMMENINTDIDIKPS